MLCVSSLLLASSVKHSSELMEFEQWENLVDEMGHDLVVDRISRHVNSIFLHLKLTRVRNASVRHDTAFAKNLLSVSSLSVQTGVILLERGLLEAKAISEPQYQKKQLLVHEQRSTR